MDKYDLLLEERVPIFSVLDESGPLCNEIILTATGTDFYARIISFSRVPLMILNPTFTLNSKSHD
jgi:hypothetical protein